MKPEGESAASIFDRINRRRVESGSSRAGDAIPDQPLARGPADPGPVPRGTLEPRPVRAHVDEVLFEAANSPSPDTRWQQGAGQTGSGSPGHGEAGADPAADRFPRSATMRLILKHPALALGLGVPAAGLLLKSPASRRLLGMAVRVGTGPELQTLIRLSSKPARPDLQTPPDSEQPFR